MRCRNQIQTLRTLLLLGGAMLAASCVQDDRSDCRFPSLEDLVRLCEFLDVSPLYLLLDDNDEASRASTVQEAFIKASESQKEAVEAILGLTGQGHK